MENVFRILAVALVVFYLFCINVIKADANEVIAETPVEGYYKNAGYVITPELCFEVLNNGNVMKQPDTDKEIIFQYWEIIYKGFLYYVKESEAVANYPKEYRCMTRSRLIPKKY